MECAQSCHWRDFNSIYCFHYSKTKMMINESHIPLGNLNENNGVDLRKAEGK